MNHNDRLTRLRYALDIKDSDMIEIFRLGGVQVTREDILAHEVGAAHLLRQAQGKTGYQSCGQPQACCARQIVAQRKVAADEGKARRGVAGRKAVAAAAIRDAPGPVRDIVAHAAEVGDVPGAARGADALHDGHDDQRQQCTDDQLYAPCIGKLAHPAGGPPDHQAQSHHDDPGQLARAFMGNIDHEPVVLQRKALAAAKPVRHGHVQAAHVPGQYAGQGDDGPAQQGRGGGLAKKRERERGGRTTSWPPR